MYRSVCTGSTDPAGLFSSTTMSTLVTNITYDDIFPPSGTDCQLYPYLHMNANSLAAVGFQSNCSNLQLGSLRFSNLAHHFKIIAGLESGCSYDKFPTINDPSVLVESFISSENIIYQLNNFISIVPSADGSIMRTSFAQDTNSFSAVIQPAKVNLLGGSLLTSLRINNTLLSLSGNISLHNM